MIEQNLSDIAKRLEGGLIPAVPAFFDAGGWMHKGAQESYFQYMSAQPVAGVAVWAHTGRGLKLDRNTADTILAGWRSALPQQVLIAGVGAEQINIEAQEASAQSLEMAERAANLGADALLVFPPRWLRESDERLIIEHHQKIASVGLPLILFYLYREAGGLNYSPTVLDKLLSMTEVIGIKMATLDSVMTYQDVSRRLLEKNPDKLLLTGEDRFLGYSLRRGARAALIGLGAICCDLQHALIDAHLNHRADEFLYLSDAVDRLAETIFIAPMEGYIKRLLWALAHLGVIPAEAAHDPWGPHLLPSEYESIAKALAAIKEWRAGVSSC